MNIVKIGNLQNDKFIHAELHSQFIEFLGSCISDGIWVGKNSAIPNYDGIRKDVVEALKKLAPPVIRWPGGCYADTYHWRDAIGKERKITWNENFGTYEQEKNEFGTDEFMKFCEMVGAKPWLNINMLTGSVQEMVEWAEYCNRKEDTTISRERASNGHPEPYNVELWGIGNEVWSGGGNYTAQSYANEYRKYATAMPSFKPNMPSQETSGICQKFIVSGPDGNKPIERVKWTREFFQALGQYRLPKIDAFDLHFYNWNLNDGNKPETDFDENDWYSVIHGCLELEDVIKEQYSLIDEGLQNIPKAEGALPSAEPKCKLFVGEWGNWHGKAFSNRPALYQQCTMRDALTTAITLDIFHRNCDKIDLACVAQTVNVLNSLILTQGEHTILTPNYYVFEMYKPHRDASLLEITVSTDKIGVDSSKIDRIYALASEKSGVITLNLVNTHFTEESEITIDLPQGYTYLSGKTLSADSPLAYNSAQNPYAVVTQEAKKPDISANGTLKATLPCASISVYQFKKS
jgi:alpha-N-arabinofuranosidase